MTSEFKCVFPDLTKGKSAEQIKAELAADIKLAEDRLHDFPRERQEELRKVIAPAKELLASLSAF